MRRLAIYFAWGTAAVGLASLPAETEAAIVWNLSQSTFCSEAPGSTLCTTDKLDARATFEFFDVSDAGTNYVSMEIKLENLSTFDIGSELTAVAFSLASGDDTINESLSTIPTEFGLDLDTSGGGLIPPVAGLDACLTATEAPPGSPKCQAGNPGDGVDQGDMALFDLWILTDPTRNAAEYEAAFVPNPITFRFQAIHDSVLGLDDASIKVGGVTTTDVVEPGTLALLSASFFGLGIASRFRRRRG